MWTTPVTDRTLADVQQGRYKGTQDYRDWNRLHQNMQHVSEVFAAEGWQVPLLDIPLWDNGTVPTQEDVEITLENFRRVSGFLGAGEQNSCRDWDEKKQTAAQWNARRKTAAAYFPPPEVAPSLPLTHYEKINQLEKRVLEVYDFFQIPFRGAVSGCWNSGQNVVFPIV